MSIWKTPFTLEELKKRGEKTLVEALGIEFIAIGDDFLQAKMPVDHRTYQFMGIMHGGASCALAETVGSVAANYCLDLTQEYCVGLDINTNHIRSIREGYVIGTARPLHIGQRTQVWAIDICDERERLISVNRLTTMVMKHKR